MVHENIPKRSLLSPGIVPAKTGFLIAYILIITILLLLPSCQQIYSPQRLAGKIIRQCTISGGLIVHYECGDGRLTAALRRDERYIVHGIDGDSGDISAARDFIAAEGLEGDVSVMEWKGPVLPYADNLVNLFISDAIPEVPMQEILRVLVPEGVALIQGEKIIKPWPESMDEWNQTRYDYTNNGVSGDSVGPPKNLRWTAGPLHARSHEENASTMAVVTAGGRMFYIQDEGLMGISDGRLPSQWRLVARDAFNGVLLWKRDIPDWGWQVWEPQLKQGVWSTRMAQRHQFPSGMARRLIAREDRVYMTLGYRAPVSVIDAPTGKIIRVLDKTENTDEILMVGDTLLALRREIPARDRSHDDANTSSMNNSSTILAIDPGTDRTLWSVNAGFIWQWSLVSDGERAFYYDADEELIHAIDLGTGEPLWEASFPLQEIEMVQYIGMSFIARDGVLFHMGPDIIRAFDAGNGDVLWTKEGKGARAPVSCNSPSMFVVDGLLWMGGPRLTGTGDLLTGYDPRSGEEVRRVEAGFVSTPGHHYRCFPPRATGRFIIMPRRGAEFLDLQGSQSMKHDWLRGTCRFGFIPSNGLFYVTPNPCFCYSGVLVNGFNAFASGIGPEKENHAKLPRFIKGPAFLTAAEAGMRDRTSEPWPMYRHDNARSGSSEAGIPSILIRKWEADPGGLLSQPTVAGGCLFIADKSGNRIVCLDQSTGKLLWQFTADAEVDSPPSFYKDLLLFGCTDGWVYCLDAKKGSLAWRYRLAPQVRLIMDESRLQSAWPVHGSVIILNDLVYAAAGRSSFLDEGIYLAAIDIHSGKPVHQMHFEGPYPDISKRQGNGYYMEGALNDLLVTDGNYIYLRQNKFDLELNHIPVEPIHRIPPPGTKGKDDKGDREVGMHLFATGGMLDDSFWNRNFWMHSRRWPGYYIANEAPKAGQLVVFDDRNTFAVKHYPRRNAHSPMNIPGKDGYLVFADRNDAPVNLYDGSEETRPVEWLPVPIKVLENRRMLNEEILDYPAVNFDKGPGLTRRTPPNWTAWHPTRFLAMSQAGNKLVLCGSPDEIPEDDPLAAFEGRLGARLVVIDAENGQTLSVSALDHLPVFDGISIGEGCIYISTRKGSILCLADEAL